MNALFQYSLLMICQKIFLEALQTLLRLADFQMKIAHSVHLQILQDDLSLQGSLRQAQSEENKNKNYNRYDMMLFLLYFFICFLIHIDISTDIFLLQIIDNGLFIFIDRVIHKSCILACSLLKIRFDSLFWNHFHLQSCHPLFDNHLPRNLLLNIHLLNIHLVNTHHSMILLQDR